MAKIPPRVQLGVIGALGVIYGVYLLVTFSRRALPVDARPSDPNSGEHGRQVFQQRLVAVGDLHGDIDNAKKVLRMAGILSPSPPSSSTPAPESWVAGDTILVQTGDIVDRGTYAWDIYRLFQRLRSEAASHGGKVVSILGNHEVMNAIGDWRYVTPEEVRYVGGMEKRMRDIGDGGWLGREWLANYSTTALVPLSPYPSAPLLSFTHGSLRPSFPNLLPYPDRINALGQSLLSKALKPPLAPPHPPNPYSGLPRDATAEEAELYSGGGPYWWRGLAEVQDDKTVCKWAKDLQVKLGVRRIIGGHTPDFEKIVNRCNASVIIIDTGISSAYGGVLSALEIVYTLYDRNSGKHGSDHRQDPFIAPPSGGASIAGMAEVAHPEPTPGERYWEREEVYAIYEKGRTLIAVEEQEITL